MASSKKHIVAPPGIHEETATLWSRRLGREVSGDESHEMIRRVSEYFRLLDKWDQAASSSFSENSES